MLIRYFDKKLREIPDELAVRVLADPSYKDEELLELDSHYVNVIIHSCLGPVFDPDKTFEENIQYAMDKFFSAEPRPQAKEYALKLIKQYHIEVKDEDIGMFPADDMI